MQYLDTITHGDAFELICHIPSESIDLIVTDPPYFCVSSEQWDNQWHSKEDYLKWMHQWTSSCNRVLKPGGSIYVFGGIGPRNGFAFWNYVEQVSNYLTFASYINWRRFRGKGYKGTHNNWPDAREDIAYFVKGDKPITFHKQYMHEPGLSSASKKRFCTTGVGLSCSNIWIDIPECQLDGGMNRTLNHPSQKPVALIDRIVSASSNPGDVVLDLFSGSGTTALSCKHLNRHYICFEKEEKYCELSLNRLASVRDIFDN